MKSQLIFLTVVFSTVGAGIVDFNSLKAAYLAAEALNMGVINDYLAGDSLDIDAIKSAAIKTETAQQATSGADTWDNNYGVNYDGMTNPAGSVKTDGGENYGTNYGGMTNMGYKVGDEANYGVNHGGMKNYGTLTGSQVNSGYNTGGMWN